MTLNPDLAAWLQKRYVFRPLETAAGLKAFTRILTLDAPQVAVSTNPSESITTRQPGSPATTQSPRSQNTKPRDDTNPALEALEPVMDDLSRICADVLKCDPGSLSADDPLSRHGLNSILMMRLMTRLEEHFNLPIEPNAVSDHPTIRGIAQGLVTAGVAAPQPTTTSQSSRTSRNEPTSHLHLPPITMPPKVFDGADAIAVVAMACRFPGADTPDLFWQHLRTGTHLVTAIPPERKALYDKVMRSRGALPGDYPPWGGFIKAIDQFDADAFDISPNEALVMDPQERIMLELAQEVFHTGGYERAEIDGKRIGIFLGAKAGS